MKSNNAMILRVSLPTPLRKSFDYIAPSGCDEAILQAGVRVRVPFRNQELIGVLLEKVTESAVPAHKLKQAIEILDNNPVVPSDILQLCFWAADYYHFPLGEIVDSTLPALLRQGKSATVAPESYWGLTELGKAVDFKTLKRAPRQIDLLQWLALHPNGVTKRQIIESDIPSTVFKTACKKGWVATLAIPDTTSVIPDATSVIPAQAGIHPEINTNKQNMTLAQAAPEQSIPAYAGMTEAPLTLNAAQQAALNAIQAQLHEFQVFLLDGVTGSGKTEVYLQAITQVLAQQKQVLVLVPEIGLTPQTIQRFRRRFSESVVALHSGLSDKERLNAWIDAKSGSAKIIIGTRSAIFSPFANLGLVIVDEEHDLSFKQQEGFRYHARDLAIMRAQAHKIPIVLGSATPSLETLCRVQQGRYQSLCLSQRAGVAQDPQFHVLDIRNAVMDEGLSASLLQAIRQHLQQGDQVMLFLNRRGFAPVLMCHACGWTAKCKRCDVRMTFHHEPRRLHCHHCDSQRPIFSKCDDCGTNDLQIIGLGTERLEQALQKHFPDVAIARIDRDSTQRKGSMEKLLEGIQRGDHKILIGTQMLAKGHHFPNVTLVGIIDSDGGFFSTDFRAIERMGQLVLQVAGRAGRVAKPGTVIVQTRHPDNPLLHQLLRESYGYFAASLLKEREQALMPPYGFLALFRAEAHNAEQARAFLQQVKSLADQFGEGIPMWGPVPAPMPRRAGRYRMQLLVQARQRPALQRCLKRLMLELEKLPSKQQVRWSLDVDPLEMF